MYLRQIEKQGPGEGIVQWADTALYEAMAAYLVAEHMPITTETEPFRDSDQVTLNDYVHSRMVMLAHARAMLTPRSEIVDRELLWTDTVGQHLRKPPEALNALRGLSYDLLNRRGKVTYTARLRKQTEMHREEFRAMQTMLRNETGETVNPEVCFIPRFAELIRIGGIFLEDLPTNARMRILRKRHTGFLKRVMEGEPISIVYNELQNSQ